MSIISIKNLSFSYEKGKKVLNNLNAEFSEGKPIALLGKNGCGKSTLLNCIMGLNDYSGEILVQGKSLKSYSERQFSKIISFIPQQIQLNMDYSVFDFISFGRNPHVSLFGKLTEKDYSCIKDAARRCGIEELLNNNINRISGGERQLAFIARALCQETSIIIMDEPTASLDFGNQQKLFSFITDLSKNEKTIFFTTHNPNHLINQNLNIFAMNNGSLFPIKDLDLKTVNEIYNDEFEHIDNAFGFKQK